MWCRRTWRLWGLLGLCVHLGVLGVGAQLDGAAQGGMRSSGRKCLAVVVYSAITGDPEKSKGASIFRGFVRVRRSAQVRRWMGWNSRGHVRPQILESSAGKIWQRRKIVYFEKDICGVYEEYLERYLQDYVAWTLHVCEDEAFVWNCGDEGQFFCFCGRE